MTNTDWMLTLLIFVVLLLTALIIDKIKFDIYSKKVKKHAEMLLHHPLATSYLKQFVTVRYGYANNIPPHETAEHVREEIKFNRRANDVFKK